MSQSPSVSAAQCVIEGPEVEKGEYRYGLVGPLSRLPYPQVFRWPLRQAEHPLSL